ncbi:MAG: hypothetical protein Q8P56_06170 [Candidatus Uhrbacteria bacterium]|nr:hypothetical protein [Candidatus Uhrbacteria bacterium]
MSAEDRTCQNCKRDFSIEPEDFLFYEKMKVPPPTFCPDCRLQRRMAWRNERAFFQNTCARCGNKGVSVYAPESGIVVYCRPCWWSDSWDGMDHGVDFDPSRPFLEQVRDLLYRIPLPDLFGLYTTLENSEYTNMVGYLKNCYFLTMADWNENCSYGSYVFHCKDSYDVLMLLDGSERCYETVNCGKCYKTMFSLDCEGCNSVIFSKNCTGCSDCIGCVNLHNKQYCIFNIQYTKSEYEERAKEYAPTTRARIAQVMAEAQDFWMRHPNKHIHESHAENVTGDYISNSHNVKNCFNVQELENARYCALVLPGKTTDAYDHSHYGISTERIYETLQVGNKASNIIASWFVIIDVMNVAYSIFAIGCKDVFGCVGIKKKQYCILNKQYTREEYERLRAQIIDQMNAVPYVDRNGNTYRYGEFFPVEMSPFAYNESGAQEYVPLTKEQAVAKGYTWREQKQSLGRPTIPHDHIPDSASAIPETITSELLECAHQGRCNDRCSTMFKVTRGEIEFYKTMSLPLPALCPNCRHYVRVAKRNIHTLYERACGCGGGQSVNHTYTNAADHVHGSNPCPNKFETTYAPERADIIYCAECYQKEII